MRKFLAIALCKLFHFIGKRIGRGSSLPGKLALAVCPDILARVELPGRVTLVTGSNGKTSTVEMTAAVLRAAGMEVICNEEGSNQIEGIVTFVLSHATFRGRVRADVLLAEVDERYMVRVFQFFHPTQLVVTNLCRDQLTRNGHPEEVYEAIRAALPLDTELLLNGDDPLSSCLARGRGSVKWFGLDRCNLSREYPTGVYHDGAYCPVCKHPMEYTYVNYNHIGGYRCMHCGHARPKPDYAGVWADLESGRLTLGEGISLRLGFHSISHAYNVLAAWAVSCHMGVSGQEAAAALDDYMSRCGRVQTFTLGAHRGTLLTSKHENSIAYDTNLQYIADTARDCTVLIIVDEVSRKYPTCETSWLWDVDFALLGASHVKRIILSGRHCRDLAACFSCMDLGNWSMQPDIGAATENLKVSGGEDVYVVTCFSDRDKVLHKVKRNTLCAEEDLGRNAE